METTILPRSTDSFEVWYDNLDEDKQLLADEINDRISNSFDEDDYEKFIASLHDYGITTAQQLEDALWYQSEGGELSSLSTPEEDFAYHLETEINCTDIPSHIENAIDWQSLWDSWYRFDFFSFEYGNCTYFFHNNF